MTDKQIIIDDQKKTIHRLQDECTEKTNAIIALGEQLKRAEQRIVDLNKTIKAKEQECERLKDKLNCCFCNTYVEVNDLEKQRKCVEVTECFRQQLDQLKKQNDIMLNSLLKLQNKLCSSTSQCKYFLMDVLKEVENASK